MAREIDDPARSANSTFNMTPMIDVVFQLIVVFLCSMKFRTLDQKIEAFLPKVVGCDTTAAPELAETRLDLRLRRRPGEYSTSVLLLGSRCGPADAPGIWDLVSTRLREFRARDATVKGEIDADPEVPHGEVVRALDAFLAADVTGVVFRGTGFAGPDTFRAVPGR